MVRIVLGVICGFIGWLVLWVVGEKVLSAVWPAFGVHQAAFQAAIENGGAFAADSTMLAVHIVLGSLVSVISGLIAALIAGEKARAPIALGVLLLAMALLKAVMSWPLVPVWYHILFTVILMPMALLGAKLRTTPR